jgi:hypothetical protein
MEILGRSNTSCQGNDVSWEKSDTGDSAPVHLLHIASTVALRNWDIGSSLQDLFSHGPSTDAVHFGALPPSESPLNRIWPQVSK